MAWWVTVLTETVAEFESRNKVDKGLSVHSCNTTSCLKKIPLRGHQGDRDGGGGPE